MTASQTPQKANGKNRETIHLMLLQRNLLELTNLVWKIIVTFQKTLIVVRLKESV
jgi:hypothetical protein